MSANFIGNALVGPAEICDVYDFGGESLAVSASSPDVLAALRKILRPPLAAPLSRTSTIVGARTGRDGWQLEVDGAVVRGMAFSTPIPRIAEEVIATACSAVAKKRSNILVSGAILAKDGVTVALIGDDLDSAKVLGFHLHARGWAAVTFGYGFVNGATLEVAGLPALASVSSTSIDQIPPRYRGAIEASLWYYSGFDLMFYTVDPLLVHPRAESDVVLTHVVIVDGELEDKPSLTGDIDLARLGTLGVQPLVQYLRFARLTLGAPIASCGAVEQWVLSSPIARDVVVSRQSPNLERTYES